MPTERHSKLRDASVGGSAWAKELRGRYRALWLERLPLAGSGMLVRGHRPREREPKPLILSIPHQANALVATAVLCIRAPETIGVVTFCGEVVAPCVRIVVAWPA